MVPNVFEPLKLGCTFNLSNFDFVSMCKCISKQKHIKIYNINTDVLQFLSDSSIKKCLLFHVLVPCLRFFTERLLHSVKPNVENFLYAMFILSLFFFLTNWYHIYHFHGQNIFFYYTKGRKLRVLHVYFFHACLLSTPV